MSLNEGLKELGDYALSLLSIESITIPSTVEKIGRGTFTSCKKLKSVTFNEGALKEIGSVAFNNTGIEMITIPKTVRKIGDSIFSGCKNLKKVTLNEGLQEIGDQAFVNSSIESITIPSTVEKIGNIAFAACQNLKAIDCKIKKSYYDTHKVNFEGLTQFIRNGDKVNWLNG